MAIVRNVDVRLHWREDGAGPPLLLLNSVGCDLTLWDGVVAHLKGFRVLRMDMRGHGSSDSPPGDATLDQIASDALAVLDAAGVSKAAVCGLSLGGMTAMTLALIAPSRVSALVLACTSARMDRQVWDARITAVRGQGMTVVVDPVMARFFSEEFCRDHAEEVAAMRARFLRLDPEGYAGCCAAIRDMNLKDRIARITAPTLIIAGDKDIATPFQGHGSEIAKKIAQATVGTVPAAHLAPVEKPDLFAALVTDFLSEVPSAS
jgi:3-oxoadipate enol-lactonase/4-carboxymuconolactone decarboxylase